MGGGRYIKKIVLLRSVFDSEGSQPLRLASQFAAILISPLPPTCATLNRTTQPIASGVLLFSFFTLSVLYFCFVMKTLSILGCTRYNGPQPPAVVESTPYEFPVFATGTPHVATTPPPTRAAAPPATHVTNLGTRLCIPKFRLSFPPLPAALAVK